MSDLTVGNSSLEDGTLYVEAVISLPGCGVVFWEISLLSEDGESCTFARVVPVATLVEPVW